MKLSLACLAILATASAKVTSISCDGCTEPTNCDAMNAMYDVALELTDALGVDMSCDDSTEDKIACEAQGGELTCTEDCFPAEATVELENGDIKRMDELNVGDRVRVGPNEFSDVYFFTHVEKASRMEFLEVTTETGKKMSISAGHLMGADGALKAARHVQVGSNVTLADGSSDIVAAIKPTIKEGLYTPQTLSGSIVVDGVLASCYTDYSSPEIQSALLTPLKMIYHAGGASWLGSNSDSAVPSWMRSMALAFKN